MSGHSVFLSIDDTCIYFSDTGNPVVTLDYSLGGKDDHESSWTKLGQSREKRKHKCHLVVFFTMFDLC